MQPAMAWKGANEMVKKLLALVLATALISTLFTPLIALASGDNIGGRETYSLQAVSEGALGNTVTFNSISITDSDYAWYKETTG